MKILPVGIEFLHADGRTDRHMTKLIVAFRNFENAPNIERSNEQGTYLLPHAFFRLSIQTERNATN